MTSTFPSYPGGYILPTFLDFALQSVVDEYAARSIELPERQYWTTGTPAADCNQVVVFINNMAYGVPGSPALVTNCDSPWLLNFSISIMRCAPVSSGRSPVPEEQQIQSTAAEVAVDMELLLEIPKRLDPARSGVTANVTALEAEGGLIGALGTYSIAPYVYP